MQYADDQSNLFESDEWSEVSVQDARDYIQAQLSEAGTACPCCSQTARMYRRAITMPMAEVLLILAHRDRRNPNPVHITRYLEQCGHAALVHGGDYAKLKLWRLIRPTARAGYYELTDAGREFARADLRLPRYVYVYNGRPIKTPDNSELIDIKEALGEGFRFTDLMTLTKEIP